MPEAMRLSNSRARKETDAGAEVISRWSSSEPCLSFVSMGVRERERGNIGRKERTCAAIGRMGRRLRGLIYSCTYHWLGSWLGVSGSKCKELPHSGDRSTRVCTKVCRTAGSVSLTTPVKEITTSVTRHILSFDQ